MYYYYKFHNLSEFDTESKDERNETICIYSLRGALDPAVPLLRQMETPRPLRAM